MNKREITFKEFLTLIDLFDLFGSCAYIHCSTFEQAKKVCNEFNKHGCCLANGDSYNSSDTYMYFGHYTAYSNAGTINDIERINNEHKIFEFDEITF